VPHIDELDIGLDMLPVTNQDSVNNKASFMDVMELVHVKLHPTQCIQSSVEHARNEYAK